MLLKKGYNTNTKVQEPRRDEREKENNPYLGLPLNAFEARKRRLISLLPLLPRLAFSIFALVLIVSGMIKGATLRIICDCTGRSGRMCKVALWARFTLNTGTVWTGPYRARPPAWKAAVSSRTR